VKALIITANVVLALLLAAAVVPMFTGSSAQSQTHRDSATAKGRTRAKGKSRAKGKDKAEPPRKTSHAHTAEKALPQTREEQKAAILDADVFNVERTPNAAFGRTNTRVELALVGTIEAGKYRAAVIIQRTNTRQINPFMRMMWGNGPGGPPGGPGGRGARRFGMGMNTPNAQRRNNPTAVKQFVKLGETMPNGYKLTALTRTRATLTRGGDKMELELQAPSKNQNAARRNPQRLNVNQQLQQAQLQTQQMMVRALMDMRNSGGNNRGGGNRGGGGGNRGGRGGRR